MLVDNSRHRCCVLVDVDRFEFPMVRCLNPISAREAVPIENYVSVDLVLIMRFYFRTCHGCQLAPITRELQAGEQALAHWHDVNP